MDIVNAILFLISLIIIIISARSIIKRGIKTYNIFAFMFFICLFFNTFKMSIYQKEKNLLDLYYLLFGSLLVYLGLHFIESFKVNKVRNLNILNIDFSFSILLGIYISLKLYISTIVGFRIESLMYGSALLVDGNDFTVPGYTGVASSLQWILLMMCPLVTPKKRFLVYIFCLALIVFAILHVKRGDVMRMLSFFFVLYLLRQFGCRRSPGYKIKKKLGRVFLIILSILFFFVFSGNIRQGARGNDDSQIILDSGVVIENSSFAWLYSYIAFNFDVLKLYYNKKPVDAPTALMNLVQPGDVERGKDTISTPNINGFNASTYLTTFISDYQELFFVELIPFVGVICTFVYFARKIACDTLYAFICMLLFLFPFGNYFETRAIVVSLFFFPFLSYFLKYNRPKLA